MTDTLLKKDSNLVASPAKTRKKADRTPRDGPHLRGGDSEARKRAAVILEVLGGLLSPSEAGQFLGLSLVGYFHLERRALEGLVQGCQACPKGRQASPNKEMEKARRETERWKKDCARYQALVRLSQRAMGLFSPKAGVNKPNEAGGDGKKGRRVQRRQARALKVARSLKKEAVESSAKSPACAALSAVPGTAQAGAAGRPEQPSA